jgi:hypothetical protein
MVNKEDKLLLYSPKCPAKSGYLERTYNLSRFDILQVKLERMRAMEDCLGKKLSGSSQEWEDKENRESHHTNSS